MKKETSKTQTQIDEEIVIDRAVFLENIIHFVELKGLKIGDVESKADLQRSYLSRLIKIYKENGIKSTNEQEKRKLPSVECFYKISLLLDIPLDVLLSYDLRNVTPTETKIIEFLDDLFEKTYIKHIAWSRIPLEIVYSDYSNDYVKPLINFKESGIYFEPSYFSPFFPNASLSKDIYFYETKSGKIIYLCKVKYPESTRSDYELVFYSKDNQEIKPMFSTRTSKEGIYSLFKKLFKEAEKSASQHISGKYIGDILDEYLKDIKK